MSYKLTYSTMFNPPETMHERYEHAILEMQARLEKKHALHIDGEDIYTVENITKRSPTNQDWVLGYFPAANNRDANEAMAAAKDAAPLWRSKPAQERIALLRRAAQIIEERVYHIAAALTLEVGKNRMEALGEAQETADFFYGYCDAYEKENFFDHAMPDDPVSGFISHNRSVMKPYGVWVVITPFNFPFALAGGPVAAALVTGNTVVLKGASETPWAGRLLADCLRDAGLPPGVFNYLSGSGAVLGDALTQHADCAGVTFTGSQSTGMHIYRHLAQAKFPKPCIAEMGGKNACIVTENADLDRAALGIVRSAFGMSGQKCSALSRLYVDEKIADVLIEKIVQAMSAIRVGDPALRENWLGPVTTKNAYESYQQFTQQLSTAGARILQGGQVLNDKAHAHGYFVAPTLAEAPLQHPLWQQEMFLPILMLHRVKNKEQAMQLANASDLGLTAGFYGAADEVDWFNNHIEAGVTYANRPQGATTGAWPGYQAFGGWKGSGSTGKAIASFYYLAQYQRQQSQTCVE